jgi:hypothetical protein
MYMQYFVCVCVCKDLHHKLFHISGRSMGLQHTDARYVQLLILVLLILYYLS